MPQYYLHVRKGAELTRDETGQTLANSEAARTEAKAIIRELLAEKLLHGGALDHTVIEISNEAGIIETVSTSDVILSKNGELRSFESDVTQSAPVGP